MPPNDDVSSITLTGGPYAYGDTITYEYEIEKLKGNEVPMVQLAGFQDIDADSEIETDVLGDDLLFVYLEPPGFEFKLLAQKWADRGGDATCRLDLLSYSWKGGQQSIRHLASSEEFTVTGP